MFNLQTPPEFRGFDEHIPLKVYHRHLPHWRQDGATYFVTFRLDDALPQVKVRELQEMRKRWEFEHPEPRNNADWEEFTKSVTVKSERWLDEGYGCCHFRQPVMAKLLGDSLVHFHRKRCFTSCYVVMPNHCHLVIQPFSGYELEKVLQICKGYVARQINLVMKKRSTVWQEESYDRIIRDEEHLYRIIQYIGRNPAMAGLPRDQWVRWIEPSWQAAGWDFIDDQEVAR
jgi:putative transposase